MSVDFDVVDALAGLAEDLRSEGDYVARIHTAVQKLERERDEARAAAADAYRRGAEAMKRAAVEACDYEASIQEHRGGTGAGIRAFGAFLSAARVESTPLPEDK